jgi:hypothetical protein
MPRFLESRTPDLLVGVVLCQQWRFLAAPATRHPVARALGYVREGLSRNERGLRTLCV